MEVVGFHGTESSAKISVAKYGLDPQRTMHRKDHWLGQGVYFFIDEGKAMWWASSVADKKNTYPIIYRVIISGDESVVLNLDDPFQFAEFLDNSINMVMRKPVEDAENTANVDIILDSKIFRCVLFDCYKDMYHKDIIIGTFEKDCVRYAGIIQEEERLKIQKDIVRKLQISFRETQICVSNKSCIKSIILYYDGEDEVV